MACAFLIQGTREEDEATGGRLTCAADTLGDVDAGHALDELRHLLDDGHHLKNGERWNYVLHGLNVFSIHHLLDHPDSKQLKKQNELGTCLGGEF